MIIDSDQLTPIDPDMSARLIDAAGSDRFGEILLSQAHEIGGIEELFGYSAGADGKPYKLISCSAIDGAAERVAKYSSRFFRHDPVLRRVARSTSTKGFCYRIRINEIIPYDYRRLCFETPHFSEKLSFGWRSGNGLLMLSFYRTREMDDDAAMRLARLADIALAALRRVAAPPSSDAFIAELEKRLGETRPELTPRERQVCARGIAGWTAERIAHDLAIAPASILTYRQRAYQRYGLSSAAEFLPAIFR